MGAVSRHGYGQLLRNLALLSVWTWVVAGAGVLLISSLGSARASVHDTEIAIGVFVPSRGEHAALGRSVLEGAQMAAADVNARGGIEGRRLRIVAASADQLWGASTRELVRLIYEENVWGIVAGTDSRSAHVAEQAVTRAHGRVLMVSPWASDPTLAQVPIPWFFRAVPDDRHQAKVLAREIFERRQLSHVAVLAESSLDSRLAALAFARTAPAGSLIFRWVDSGSTDDLLALQLNRSAAEAAVLFLDPSTAARRIQNLRKLGLRIPLFGTLRLAVADFLEQAGPAGEGIVLVAPNQGNFGAASAFSDRYTHRYGKTPEATALYSHDAVMALAEAVRRAAFERPALAEAMRAIHIKGLTGTLCFSDEGERCEAASLGRIFGSQLIQMHASLPGGLRKGDFE